MDQKGIQMDDYKGPSNGNVQSTYLADKEDPEYLGPTGGNVSAKYMGTVADKRDMSVLGRDQVLRVSHCAMSLDLWTNNVMRSATSNLSPSSDLAARLSAHGRFS